MFSFFSKPKPPPRTFEIIHPEIPEPPKQEIGPLPPNVYLASDAPSEKPAANWLRMVCISDTHNTTDANNYSIPQADILGEKRSTALKCREGCQRTKNINAKRGRAN